MTLYVPAHRIAISFSFAYVGLVIVRVVGAEPAVYVVPADIVISYNAKCAEVVNDVVFVQTKACVSVATTVPLVAVVILPCWSTVIFAPE